MKDAPFIVVVEDHPRIRASTVLQLREEGFAVHGVASAEEATTFLATLAEPPDLLLVDVRLNGATGIDLLRTLSAKRDAPPAIVITGEASMGEAVEALRLGVYDLIEKPFTRERLLQSVRNCLENASLKREVTALQSRVQDGQTIVGRSPQIAALRERIDRVAATGARVLIRGESGTGKELVASMLHRRSPRHAAPFVKTNCAAIPAPLIEDELFGHARGAFTDAKYAKPGLFEEAHGGTLFLDEIGDMELSLQSRLLRVLEDGKVRRVGETSDRVVDVRVVTATNRNLEEMVAQKQFREDLYFRLNTVPIDVPPLREREGDVALLFSYFLERFCAADQRRRLTVDSAVFPLLEQYRWPGNVRELRNVCEQVALFGIDPITPDQLPSWLLQPAPEYATGLVRLADTTTVLPLRVFKEQSEKEYIESILRRTNWNFSAAAELLGIQRTYLHHKVATLGIQRPR